MAISVSVLDRYQQVKLKITGTGGDPLSIYRLTYNPTDLQWINCVSSNMSLCDRRSYSFNDIIFTDTVAPDVDTYYYFIIKLRDNVSTNVTPQTMWNNWTRLTIKMMRKFDENMPTCETCLNASQYDAYASALNSSGNGSRSIDMLNREITSNLGVVIFETDTAHPITDSIITEKLSGCGVKYFQRLFQNNIPYVEGYDTNLTVTENIKYRKRN